MFPCKKLPILILLTWSVCISNAAPKKNYIGVLNGEPTSIESFPYQVAVSIGWDYICSGVIIDEQFILTAAQCSSGFPELQWILAGTTNTQHGGQIYYIEKIIEHPDYIYTAENDICIMKLKEKLQLSDKVAIATLSTDNETYSQGTVFNLTGWGEKKFNINETIYSDVLRIAEVPFVDTATCEKNYARRFFEMDSRMICAGSTDHDACQGDGGSPLTVNGTVVGLATIESRCGRNGQPTIYTRVSAYVSWIRDTLRQEKKPL